MTIRNDIVLWDNGNDRLCLFPIPFEHQYRYTEGFPCITFGVSYENAHYRGCDIFTLFDHFYAEILGEIETVHRSLNGTFRIDDIGADTDGYLVFKMHNGLLSVKGQLGASFSSHSLTFEFNADQTLVSSLLQAIAI